MADKATVDRLRERVFEYRKLMLELCCKAKGLHIGGDLSCAEMLTALFQYEMNVDAADPTNEDRDRFVLSKGHSSAGLYIAMAQKGFFDLQEIFDTYKGHETRFGAHPCRRELPELESSSGSLGHGLSIASGMALAARLDNKKYRAFCLVGDGESSEGSIWEAALGAQGLKLGNLVAVVDRNMMGLDGFTEEIMPLEPYADKWRAFNWNTVVIDGHDLNAVVDSLDNLPPYDSDRPTVIICNTVKGKGVSFMESVAIYHHTSINEQQLAEALAEVEAAYKAQTGGDSK
jgi:transketolase